MQNITLSAQADVIARARSAAKANQTTLNEAFRKWLESYAAPGFNEREYEELLNRVAYARAGKRFTREEMNER